MRASSFRYLVREGFRSIWQNRFMALASIGVLVACLLLTGGAFLIFENINHAFDTVYDQNVVVAYAKVGTSADDLKVLQTRLEGITNVSKVTFKSKDDVLKDFGEELSESLLNELMGENNPMQDTFIITFADLEKFDATLYQLENVEGVDEVSSRRDVAKQVTTMRGVILAVSGWIIALLLIVSLFIIANTIKLTVYNRRLEINIMKAVGATNGFIRFPFVVEGMVLGLLAALLSFGLVYFIYSRLILFFDVGFALVPFSQVWLVLLLGFLGIGLLTGMGGSAISMGKYLREKGGVANEGQGKAI